MNLDKVKAWVTAHKKPLALGGAAVAVAGVALVRRRGAAAAGGVAVNPVAGPADPTAADSYSEFTSAIQSLAHQQQAGQQDLIDQIGGALGYQADSTAAALSGLAQQQAAGNSGLADMLTGALQTITGGASEPKAATAPRVGTQGVYTFQPGDTVDTVAQRYGITVGQLLAANPTSGKGFTDPGHRVTVPTAAASSSGPKPSIVYTPGKGESVASIAAKFGISVAQLTAANSKSGQPLNTAGHRITIPGQ